MDEQGKLTYLVAQKGPILVVTFVGPFSNENSDVFSNCASEISKLTTQFVILNFRDVPPKFDRALTRPMVQFQAMIRSFPAELRLIGIHPKLKALLDEQGILHSNELSNNIAEAIQSFAKKS